MVCLSGELGAGKTTFSSGIGVGWGAVSALTSPTFVIVRQHYRPQDGQSLYHLDTYRVDSEDDLESIGFDDIVDADGAVLIEWAEKIEAALPPDALWIYIAHDEDDDDTRIFDLSPKGINSTGLLARFQQGEA